MHSIYHNGHEWKSGNGGLSVREIKSVAYAATIIKSLENKLTESNVNQILNALTELDAQDVAELLANRWNSRLYDLMTAQ